MAKAKAKAKPAKARGPARRVPLPSLLRLLGKTEDDPDVATVLATAGEIEISKYDFIIAKEAGFDIAMKRDRSQKRRVLTAVFLFPEGGDDHRGFLDLPPGFDFVTRRELLAKHPDPIDTRNLDGKLPIDAPDSEVWDEKWRVGDHEVGVQYGHKKHGGRVRHFYISLPEDDGYEGPLDTDPLYFETLPYDSPPDAGLVGMALIAAWAAQRFGLPAKHANRELGEQLASRAITPRTFLIEACDRTLASADVVPQLGKFLAIYTYNHHQTDTGERKPTSERIKELLKLERDDERRYTDDFLATFADCGSPHYVPDSWAAVERIAPVLDARWADFQATQFQQPPDLARYETAARLRDEHSITPARAQVPPAAIDDALADELVALIGKPLTDKHVKAVLARAGLPVGKRIDAQANPALGASYMGTKFPIDGKNQLGIEDVAFYADGVEHPIRGIGKTVRFRGYPGPLPFGLRLGASRATVRERVGKPMKSGDDYDQLETETHRMGFRYTDDRLVLLRITRPLEA
jgi:hypothetical protein